MLDPLTDRHARPTGRSADAGMHHDRRALAITVAVAAIVCGAIAVVQRNSGDDEAAASAAVVVDAGADLTGVATTLPLAAGTDPSAVATDPAATALVDGAVTTTAVGAELVDLDGGEDTTAEGSCTMDKLSVRLGDSGNSVTCLQQALITAGFYTGTVNGQFDQATFDAVEDMQTEKDLFVDGVVGRETALALGIWPDENALVVHTPPPAPGAVDSWGYELSYVATTGADTPPLPENSGSGYRLVYDRAGQRVWAVDENETVIRSWLVSGSKYSNELPGTHQVYSKSETSTAWNGKAILPLMVRWLKTRIGNIGFHGIPRHVEDGSRYQTDQELGTRLSGGCQRQADLDAKFVWDFADIGTTVVVL